MVVVGVCLTMKYPKRSQYKHAKRRFENLKTGMV